VRRWPREVTVPMTAGLPPSSDPDIEYVGHASYKLDVPGVALDIEQVSLELIGQEVLTRKVAPGAQGVSFEVDLKPGDLDFEACLKKADGTRMGAYYVYAEKVE